MSHRTGKIESIAAEGDTIFLKYRQARFPEDEGRFFKHPLPLNAGWLADL